MTISKRVTKDDFHYVYLHIMNGLLRLTEKEILVLSEFMKLQDFISKAKSYLTQEERRELLFSSESRKDIQVALKMSPFSLNNYIKSLKEKKAIIEFENELIIRPTLFLSKDKDATIIEFKLVDEQV